MKGSPISDAYPALAGVMTTRQISLRLLLNVGLVVFVVENCSQSILLSNHTLHRRLWKWQDCAPVRIRRMGSCNLTNFAREALFAGHIAPASEGCQSIDVQVVETLVLTNLQTRSLQAGDAGYPIWQFMCRLSQGLVTRVHLKDIVGWL